ncbi:MAG: AAA family ATPase [Deltaproteobacteria bacterium]|nr:AAA family ATPase [Deltaproteobacteria bacterium]
MTTRHRKYQSTTSLNHTSHAFGIDKNEAFVFRQSIAYLFRLRPFLSKLDFETLKFIHWLIPEESKAIVQFIIQQMPQNEKAALSEEILECMTEPDSYPRNSGDMMEKLPQRKIQKVIDFCVTSLEVKYNCLSYRGQSEMEKAMEAMCRIFQLTEPEKKLCWFFFICSNRWERANDLFIDHLKLHTISRRRQLLAVLDINYSELTAALSGTLSKLEILTNSMYGIDCQSDFLNYLENPASEKLTKKFYAGIPKQSIPLEYHYVDPKETAQIIKLLKDKTVTSTHILLYGNPGTGKTSYAYGLAQSMKVPTYQIVQDETNQVLNRRNAIVACLQMTNKGDGSLIIVDEADNVINTQNSWFKRGETQDKGWLNKILEEPGTRMIWITNDLDSIEESVLRRFSYSLHFQNLNRQQRIRVWQRILEKNRAVRFFNQLQIETFAKQYEVSAGVIDLAVRKAKEMKLKSKEDFSNAVILAIDAHERLLRGGGKKKKKNPIEKDYSLDGLNIKGDLKLLMRDLHAFDEYLRKTKLSENRNMNLLFYGPPGTGKSELARYIAHDLNREIICKRASDIVDCYVGQTEKNLKKAFDEAERDQAVLVFDEADTFLFNRDMAQRSWEISATNEFLTQMERYNGILICTTNRMTGLDNASLRRFNHKFQFNYLTPEGNVIFFRKLLSRIAKEQLKQTSENDLRGIKDLAPGDFRIVKDRYAILPGVDITPEAMIKALLEESRIKDAHRGHNRIGFLN